MSSPKERATDTSSAPTSAPSALDSPDPPSTAPHASETANTTSSTPSSNTRPAMREAIVHMCNSTALPGSDQFYNEVKTAGSFFALTAEEAAGAPRAGRMMTMMAPPGGFLGGDLKNTTRFFESLLTGMGIRKDAERSAEGAQTEGKEEEGKAIDGKGSVAEEGKKMYGQGKAEQRGGKGEAGGQEGDDVPLSV